MARTNQKVEVNYHMRNDRVLIRLVRVEQVRGLFMPEASIQGQQYVVEAYGPDVKDLKKGDVVFVTGKIGVDIGLLPNDSTLLVCKQDNILLVMEPVVEEE